MGVGDDHLANGRNKAALDAFTKGIQFDRENAEIYRKRAGTISQLILC
jgi:hypothetical protein